MLATPTLKVCAISLPGRPPAVTGATNDEAEDELGHEESVAPLPVAWT
jgi:hypothetical protein